MSKKILTGRTTQTFKSYKYPFNLHLSLKIFQTIDPDIFIDWTLGGVVMMFFAFFLIYKITCYIKIKEFLHHREDLLHLRK